MTLSRSVTEKAVDAADAILDWLRTKPAQPRGDMPVDAGTASPLVDTADATAISPAYDTTIERHRPTAGAALPLRLPVTDWLHHRMTVTGPPSDITRFRSAAAGSGIIPWHFDLVQMEEDLFHLLAAPPSLNAFQSADRGLSVAGARIFASQLRAAVHRRHDLAVASVGRSTACLFDLNALVPVPGAILALGPDDPAAVAWLWQHWGTTEPLRHVAENTPHAPPDLIEAGGPCVLSLCFWSADWTPWQALAQVMAAWPALTFDVTPTYTPL